MILIDSGRRDARSIDAKITFAMQLAARGHDVGIDVAGLPEDLNRGQKYELAPLAVDGDKVDASCILVIGAEDISDETLTGLRATSPGPDVDVFAIGRFESRQSVIGARARLAYALGREPRVLDLTEFQPNPLLPTALSPLAASKTRLIAPRSVPEVFVFFPPEALDDPMTLPMLAAVDQMGKLRLNVLIAGKGKEQIRQSKFTDLKVHGYSELSPRTFAQMTDIAVFFGEGVPGERMAAFALDLMRRGGVVIDGTADAAFAVSGAPILRGPADLAALPNYLETAVLANLGRLGKSTAESKWLDGYRIERIEATLRLGKPKRRRATDPASPKTIFFPTNGNGLGHARRCQLIADTIDKKHNLEFAAFPSCISTITTAGYPCQPLVQRSPDHPEPYANDIVNYLRLSRRLEPGDRLVFDGGFVFDSVYRTIMENDISAVWLRRGLWQPGQSVGAKLDREMAFDTVIVPDEAFPELNTDLTFSSTVRHVGPVVEVTNSTAKARKSRLKRVLSHFGRPATRLVVTMLGAGVAADRSAQLQALAAKFERRNDCLHLVVIWPGARIAPGLFCWKNTQVVQTRRALQLAEIADFVISAVGYNSFHELLYNGIPAIFIPQKAEFMDDQERRARAASERGLGQTVLAHELVMLERQVTAFLDGPAADEIRKKFKSADLPARGIKDAADLISKGCIR